MLVQWGKSDGPFSRIWLAGGGEGPGRVRAVVDGPVRTVEEEQPGVAADTGDAEKEATEGNAGGEPADEGASDALTAV